MEMTQESVRDTAKAVAREAAEEILEKEKQRLRKKAKKRAKRLVRRLLTLAALLCLGWLIGVHRRVILAALLHLEPPKAPDWHFWCKK